MTSTTTTKTYPDLDVADRKLQAILRQIRGLGIREGAEGAADVARELHEWADDVAWPATKSLWPDEHYSPTIEEVEEWEILRLLLPLAVYSLPHLYEIDPVGPEWPDQTVADLIERCWRHYRTAIEGRHGVN